MMNDLALRRVVNQLREDRNQGHHVYARYSSPEWIINRVIAICHYVSNATGYIKAYPVMPAYSAVVYKANMGHSDRLIGVLDYLPTLPEEFNKLGELAQVAAAEIWRLSEELSIPPGHLC